MYMFIHTYEYKHMYVQKDIRKYIEIYIRARVATEYMHEKSNMR